MWPKWSDNKPFTIAVLALIAYAVCFLWVSTDKLIAETKQIGQPIPFEHTIYVEGTGKASATPDVATISFGAETRNEDQATAQNENSTKTNALLSLVKAQGIAEEDIQTSDYSIWQDCVWDDDYNECTPTDWVVSQSVTVKVRDTAKVAGLLSVLGQNGASNVYGPSFEVDDLSAAKAEARAAAIKDAEANAKQLAKELGVHLDGVIGYSEYAPQPPYPYYDREYAAEGIGGSIAPEIEIGSQEVSLTVTVTYKLKE
jgi:uncharacterized protein YggE